MRQPSIVIHKGRREEKYELYVEDYVISFLKEKADMLDTAEVLFYGCREKGGRQYTIYGAGQDRHLAVFDKYDLLEEIGCRLTKTDPVFLIKEAGGTYEVKGYKVFYNENEEMQDYLIYRNKEEHEKRSFRASYSVPGRRAPRRTEGRFVGQNAISLQLGLVFVVLIAIVINSTNSYDKMKQLNQSAEEVFFVMENQEAEETAEIEPEDERNDIVVERETQGNSPLQDEALQDNLLQDSVLQENVLQGQINENAGTGEEEENGQATGHMTDGTDIQEKTEAASKTQPETDEAGNPADAQVQTAAAQEEETREENSGQDTEEDKDGVEALSRNVARYYEVERGDTLYMISQKVYGDTSHVKRICEINQITNPDNIRYGQKIILP